MLTLKESEPIIAQYDNISYEYITEHTLAHYVDDKYADYGVFDYNK